MSMMHVDFPRKKGWFQWDELGCMARALGFPSEIYYNNIPEEFLEDHSDDNGLSLKNFLTMLKVHKVFNKAVDKTCNIHTDEWNMCVIEKALNFLDNHVVTFEDLYRIRMSYQVYENADTKGLSLTEKSLLRTLKMCDRMISPLKMLQRIKHMKEDFDEEGRIQLHEILDLILWCDIMEQVELETPRLDCSKNEEELYTITDFEELIQHYDEKLHKRLNAEYRSQELTFVKEKHGSKKMPKDVAPVDPEVRKKQVAYHKEKYTFLQNELNLSARMCHQAKAGKVRGRPITAPDLLIYHDMDASMRISTLDPRPATVYETIGHIIRPLTRQSSVALSDIKHIVARPDIHRYKRPCTPSAVKNEEEQQHERIMQALDFEMSTVDHKYRQLLYEDMDMMLPGFREKMAKRPRVQTPIKDDTRIVEERPSQETLQRLAYHDREAPRPAHATACDARYRGWHKTRIKKGNHYILIAPSFENSDVGRQLEKLRRNASRDGKLDRFVHRLTTKETVQPDKPKSRATKRNLEPIDVNKVDDSFSNDSSRPPMIVRESTRIYDAEDTPLSRRRARDESDKDGRTNLVTPRKGSSDVTLKPDLKNSLDEFNESFKAHLLTTDIEPITRDNSTLEAIKEENIGITRASKPHSRSSTAPQTAPLNLAKPSTAGRPTFGTGKVEPKAVTLKTPQKNQLQSWTDRSASTTRESVTRDTNMLAQWSLRAPKPTGTRKQRVTLDRLVTRVEGVVSVDLQAQLRGLFDRKSVQQLLKERFKEDSRNKTTLPAI